MSAAVARSVSCKSKKHHKPEKGRVKGETVEPVNLMALYEMLGTTDAARAIGVSTATVHKARRGKVVSKVADIAARYILENVRKGGEVPDITVPFTGTLPPADAKNAVFIISIEREKEKMVRDFAKVIGAKIAVY